MEIEPAHLSRSGDHDASQQAWHALHSVTQHSGVCGIGAADSVELDYVQYCQAAEICDPRLAGHLTASAFLRFRRGAGGTVSAAAVHAYLARRAAMLELWQHLAAFDEAGSGALTAEQLEAFIACLATELPALRDLEQHLPLRLYAAAAARKLLFFHGRAGRVRIRDLVLSPVLAELLQLPAPVLPHPASPQGVSADCAEGGAVAHEDGGEDCDEDGSWFAPGTAKRLVGLFQGLAGGRDFLLPDDLVRFSGGNLTELFAARVFEEHATSSASANGSFTGDHPHPAGAAVLGSVKDLGLPAAAAVPAAMHLIDFLDFLLAWEHRGTPQGLRYFWPVLDLRRQGCLAKADAAAWFREVHALWLGRGLYAELRVADVVQEVFDLAAPAVAQRITLSDLQRCGAGGNIVGMLADVAAFWEHDSKEVDRLLQSLLAAETDVATASRSADQPQVAQLDVA